MADPQPLLTMPAGTPTWVASWISAFFQYLLAPTIVGVLAAWMASRQFRHTILTERQRAAAKLIDELGSFGRRVDERLRRCDIAFKSKRNGDLPILEDLQIPDIRDSAAVLGPKVAMQHQMLKDAFSRSSEEVTFFFLRAGESKADQNSAVEAAVTFVGPAIEDVLIQIYLTINAAARVAKLPYKLDTRVPLKELERRRGLRILLHPNERPSRLSIVELVKRGSSGG